MCWGDLAFFVVIIQEWVVQNPPKWIVPDGSSSKITSQVLKLRLALVTILNCKMGSFLCVLAMVCSSFVTISAGTHYRAPWNPLGRDYIPMVAQGNQLASRIVGYGFRSKCSFKLLGDMDGFLGEVDGKIP